MLRLRNIASEPKNSYRIDVPTVFGLVLPGITEREFNDQVMVWHTHPSGMVGPSAEDCSAMVCGVNYCVVTVPSGEVVRYVRDL